MPKDFEGGSVIMDIGRAAHPGHDHYQLYRAFPVFIQDVRNFGVIPIDTDGGKDEEADLHGK